MIKIEFKMLSFTSIFVSFVTELLDTLGLYRCFFKDVNTLSGE